ncbi:MAG TPA: 16S rRNA (uracil(1498)-N(3))-methyltransferase [Rhizomicrobium sp.]|nr:16S rRNA (uracil(1498)-N(3))-methyltransferase [Rhizomicrobium sp.]
MSDNELTITGGKLRLYVEQPLAAGSVVTPDDAQAHYLVNVMRARVGDKVSLFNGRDGEWLARVTAVAKRTCSMECELKLAAQTGVPDIWLCFAPIKKTPADYVVQKATELGASVLQPVFTRRTIVSRVNGERMRANAIEAAEQSGRLSVPDVREPVAFEKLLGVWPKERRLIFCDEGGDARPIAEVLRDLPDSPFAIMIGPEGGFDPAERVALRVASFVTPVSLGTRILRADTAALAALAIWQTVRGDWR